MYLFPVMGSAYINAHRMTKAKAKGCLLLIDPNLARRASVQSIVSSDSDGCGVVDWIHADIPEMQHIAGATQIPIGERVTLERHLKEEAREAASTILNSAEWLENTLRFNHCE